MPIGFSQYIQITSGVGGQSVVPQRDLITRIFTTNPLVPTGGYKEFSSASDVGDYFGNDSEEYLRAAFYFAWVSKNITQANKISYARWVDEAVAPRIYGDEGVTQALGSWTSITAGTFYITLGENSLAGPEKILLTGLDFSAAGSLAAVAAIIQAAIRAAYGTALWTGSTVVFNATRGTFDFVGGDTGPNIVAVDPGASNDIAAQLGWIGAGTILSDGSDEQTITDVLALNIQISNNFGSLLFMPALDDDQVTEAAAWTDLQNVAFMYLLPADTETVANTYYTDLQTYSGVAVTLRPDTDEYPEMIPGIILAATDYAAQNSVQNYMFQLNFPGLAASVTDTQTSETLNNIRCNYYGNTQTAGRILTFYQRGVLMGGTTAPVDQNVFANEMWLKDAAGASIMDLLLALPVVSANKVGQSQVLGVLQSVIDLAVLNGTISVGKTLNTVQKLFITQETGSDKAWYQVQTVGYWVAATTRSYVTQDDRTEFEIVYTLIYSKDDAIRKVIGRHVLI